MLLILQLLQIQFEAIQTLLPELAVFIHPAGGRLQRPRFKPAGPPLRPARPRDEARVLEHLEMLGNRRQRQVKRLGKFIDRFFTPGKLRQNVPPRRIGQCGKGCAKRVVHAITLPFG